MDRITRRDDKGNAHLNCKECDELEHETCGWKRCRIRVLKRLAAYEDTGLTPEEVLKCREEAKTKLEGPQNI